MGKLNRDNRYFDAFDYRQFCAELDARCQQIIEAPYGPVR